MRGPPFIKATNGRGYTVPCVVDGKLAICDVTDFGQEVALHIDRRYTLNLFPKEVEGIQLILSRYIENDLEMVGVQDQRQLYHPITTSGRTGHADPTQGTEVRKGLSPGMDKPSHISLRAIRGATDADRQDAG